MHSSRPPTPIETVCLSLFGGKDKAQPSLNQKKKRRFAAGVSGCLASPTFFCLSSSQRSALPCLCSLLTLASDLSCIASGLYLSRTNEKGGGKIQSSSHERLKRRPFPAKRKQTDTWPNSISPTDPKQKDEKKSGISTEALSTPCLRRSANSKKRAQVSAATCLMAAKSRINNPSLDSLLLHSFGPFFERKVEIRKRHWSSMTSKLQSLKPQDQVATIR